MDEPGCLGNESSFFSQSSFILGYQLSLLADRQPMGHHLQICPRHVCRRPCEKIFIVGKDMNNPLLILFLKICVDLPVLSKFLDLPGNDFVSRFHLWLVIRCRVKVDVSCYCIYFFLSKPVP